MNIQDLPPNYRHVVRHEGCGTWGAVAWPCLACAIESIPIGTGRIIQTPIETRYVCRVSQSMYTTVYVRLDRQGYVAHQYGDPCTEVIASLNSHHHGPECPHIDITSAESPVPFGRRYDESDAVREPATVASVEAFLRRVSA